MSLSNDLHAIPRLFGDAVEQLGKLVQNEARLAQAEISQKMTQAAIGASYLAGAALLMVPVLVMLLIALAVWLHQSGMSAPAACLVAAAVGALASVILGLIGRNYMKPGNLVPRETARQVQRDLRMAKELVR